MTDRPTHCPTGADPDEARAFLAANPDVTAIDLVLTDTNGVARGKIIRRHELASIWQRGRHLPVSILGLDICGEDVHETGLIWDQGDRDIRAWPVPGSLRRLHGTTPARAELLLAAYDLDGAPMACDPRNALLAAAGRLAGAGLRAAGAFELEFFLLDPEPGPDGRYRPAAAALDGRRSDKTEVYSVDHLHGMLPLIDAIYAAAETAGIQAETVISEYAPGQYELTLHYRDTLVAAADDLVRLKRIVRAAARRHGALACFMAKPMADYAGSGMHLHVSLWDDAGRNALAMRHAIGGLLSTMAESMLVFAPHANSWRRFAAESYAPVAPTWGINNRSVAVRIPAGDPAARRIEHRPAGVDANPYLVGATVLEGLRTGLASRIEPPAESTGNGYSAVVPAGWPTDWGAAIAAARGSDFLARALGAELRDAFVAIKAAECARVARTIADVDFDLYLHTV
jgi:glutamine synthetase